LTGESSGESESLFVKGNNRSYFSHGIQSIIDFDYTSDKLKHNVQVGVRYHQDAMDRYQNEDQYSMNNGAMFQTYQGELGTESNRLRRAYALASHIQYTLSFNKLDLTPGIRYENIELNEIDYGKTDPLREGIDTQYKSNAVSIFLPGIGINYSWNEKFSTYAGLHRGFAPPGLTEGSIPEESLNYELGTKFFGKFLNFQTALFFNDYKNLLGNDLAATGGNGSGNMHNGGKAQTMGAELFATINTIKLLGIKSRIRIPITVSYTFTDAQFLSSFESSFDSWGNVNYGDEFPYLSKHQFSSRISLEHSKFEINLNAKYNSAMRAEAGSANLSQAEHVPSYLVFDGGVKYYLNKQISFNITVQNITNQAYIVALRPAGLRPGLPRVFQFGISAKL
jgi:Fe(3+) dicitrate transport protein